MLRGHVTESTANIYIYTGPNAQRKPNLKMKRGECTVTAKLELILWFLNEI